MGSARTLWGIVLSVGVGLLASAAGADEVAWTGLGDGSTYSDAANWDSPGAPINNGTTWDVTIGGTPSVVFDAGVGGDTVDALSFGAGATLTVNSGLTLNVLGVADVGGRVNVDKSTFSAPSPTSLFSGQPRLFAANGGQIDVGASSWSATAGGGRLLRVAGR